MYSLLTMSVSLALNGLISSAPIGARLLAGFACNANIGTSTFRKKMAFITLTVGFGSYRPCYTHTNIC